MGMTAKKVARHGRRTALFSALLVATTMAGSMTAMAQNASATQRGFDIAAQPLAQALMLFGRQSGLQVTAAGALTKGLTSAAVKGDLAPAQALSQLLAGTGLAFRFVGSNGVVVERAPQAANGAIQLGAVRIEGVDEAGSSVSSDPYATEGTGSYTQTGSSGAATGLGLTLRQTPQSVTVMTRQRMDDFKLETLTDVMEQTPGITIFRQGSHIEFEARGTGVNLQTEGNQQISSGYAYFTSTNFTLDSLVDIDRIEVLKGSNGLIVGKGNTGATVNLIRKRAPREFQASISASAGSWSNYSANVDVGGSLNAAGTLRGRVVAAVTDGKSFRDYEKNESRTLFGTLELDLTPDTLLSAGVTYREREVRGLAMWINIRAYNSSNPTEFLGWKPRSYNPATPWAGYEQESTNVFSRLEHQFANGWTSKIQLAHENIEIPELLVASSTTQDFDTATRYLNTKNRNSSLIADLKGPVNLFGRIHDVLLGAGASNSSSDFDSNKFGSSHHYQKHRYAYVAARINLVDPLKFIVGTRVTNYENESTTMYGRSVLKETCVVTPYAGLVYDVSKDISLYGSYASIFQPQSNQDEQGRTLDPEEGLTYEIGAKGEFFDKHLNASISHFWIRTDNVAESTGGLTPSGSTAYRGVMGASRRGYELELSGELARSWQLQAGYTMNSSSLSNSDRNPKHQFKLGSTYRLAGGSLRGLTVGASTRWQSTTSATAAIYQGITIRQSSYWLLDLMARYQVNNHWSFSTNINNVLDKKYYQPVAGQGLGYTWGAPRSFNVSVRYNF
jgi:outer membrane receptor for ferric coprogen and ferric-rhodotorulic acid